MTAPPRRAAADLSELAVILSALIVAVVAMRAVLVVRGDPPARERGSLPGEGYHEIQVNYDSGGGGGTQLSRFTVPKDPQEYARRFVPRGRS